MENQENQLWRRSSKCDTGDCVETAITDDGVGVRDSKDPDGPVLMFAVAQWEDFTAAAREGTFG